MLTPVLALLIASLPLYPGAKPKVFAENQTVEMKTYWVEQPMDVVVAWYSKELRTKAIRQKDDAALTYILTLKNRTINMGGSVQTILIKGVVLWGEPGGSTYLALVDRESPGGSVQMQKGAGSLEFGPDAPVKKAVGADPDRYNNERLQGRSVQGRSVQGSFR